MNIVAYTSSWNGKEALNSCIQGLLKQTYPLKEIIVVDNRSSEEICIKQFPKQVSLICHLKNLGVGGAAATAFEYALQNDYDLIWVLDQDTTPKPDALQKLVEFFQGLDAERQNRIGIISSLVVLFPSNRIIHGRLLTPGGPRPTPVDPHAAYYECDANIWSGSLYNLVAVKKVGLPRFGVNGVWEDFCMDYGDLEYSFRIKQAGFEVLGHNHSHIIHQVGEAKNFRIFNLELRSTNHSAFRRYLFFRNMVYFWLYIYPDKNIFFTVSYLIFRTITNCGKILLLEKNRWRKINAILFGVLDGFKKNLNKRRFYNG